VIDACGGESNFCVTAFNHEEETKNNKDPKTDDRTLRKKMHLLIKYENQHKTDPIRSNRFILTLCETEFSDN